jgi:hypothetical protein
MLYADCVICSPSDYMSAGRRLLEKMCDALDALSVPLSECREAAIIVRFGVYSTNPAENPDDASEGIELGAVRAKKRQLEFYVKMPGNLLRAETLAQYVVSRLREVNALGSEVFRAKGIDFPLAKADSLVEALAARFGATSASDKDANAADETARPRPHLLGPFIGAAAPSSIAIDPDDGSARNVGRTADGRQFFLTTPFEPAGVDAPVSGCEYVALYLFDREGKLLEARIDSLGPRAKLDRKKRERLLLRRLDEIGPVTLQRIEVAPFSVDRFGTTFGLVLRDREEEVAARVVEAQPGNYMAFSEPWDSGQYDT